ncbi:GlxA family transcriptional regulator [Streptacidiphilus sp. PB12-B1b]|uniref:GlxA family transcriptional regulator n=1 Tax=Streptacidiphilus sp. PB12-B1b TaxID=2705012 RepID=UPI001CDB674F|nr:GlxA family transcriptional regulator [Streptacidiphilus sp. PB12-B1b]
MSSRRIVFVVFPDFQILDLTGPHEVFAQVGRLTEGGGRGVEIHVVAAAPGPVAATGGIAVLPTGTIDEVTGPVDTLVAVGGRGVLSACEDSRLVGWFGRTAARARRTASVCSGAFLLAEAGLLDGRRAVTHWSRCGELAQRYPRITVDPDPIFIRDGDVWTSAGITAGIDLALAMAEADHGPELSRAVARQLVMFVQRPGGQAQFSTQLAAQRPPRAPLRELQAWLADHLDADLTVPALAARAAMSERNFARVFHAETGRTPAAYVETARIEAARRLLETTDTSIEAIARSCGFGTVETLHRSFRRTVRATPAEYRRRFSSSGTG